MHGPQNAHAYMYINAETNNYDKLWMHGAQNATFQTRKPRKPRKR